MCKCVPVRYAVYDRGPMSSSPSGAMSRHATPTSRSPGAPGGGVTGGRGHASRHGWWVVDRHRAGRALGSGAQHGTAWPGRSWEGQWVASQSHGAAVGGGQGGHPQGWALPEALNHMRGRAQPAAYNPGGWWERRGWAAGTALVGPLGPGALSLLPKGFKPRKSEGRALSQAPQTVGVLWMQGQAGPELRERGEEPGVRRVGPPGAGPPWPGQVQG